MPEKFPSKLPDIVCISGKTFVRVAPQEAVQRGICKRNDGKWHYYVSQNAHQYASNPGERRHFSVFLGQPTKGGNRAGSSIHVSLKAHGIKQGVGSYWFDYSTQKYSANPTWRNIPLQRKAKAERLLKEFVEALTKLEAGGSATATGAVKPLPIPTWEELDAEKEETLEQEVVADSWEDLVD